MFHQLPKQTVAKEVKQGSIQFILQETNLAPQTFYQFVRQFYKDFGLRFIFQGIEEVFLIVALLFIPAIALFAKEGMTNINIASTSYFIALMVTPITFGLLYFLSIWKEILVGTFELKQTLRITLKELMLMRILVFSGVALLVSVVANFLLWLSLDQKVSLIQLMSVSFVALFLFTSGQLILELNISLKRYFYLSPILWFALSGVLLFFQKAVGTFLMNLPAFVTILLLVAAPMSYLYLMKKNYALKKEGGLVDART